MAMKYMDSEHLEQWIESGRASVAPVEACSAFHDYLLSMAWLPTRLDWRGIDHMVIDVAGMGEPEFVAQAMRSSLGSRSHLLAVFSPGQPGIICQMKEGLANLDHIYWKAPGVRYFCGIDTDSTGVYDYSYQDFGEFDGSTKVTLRRPRAAA
ncbi:hypothetical protein [Saccharomonospora cyanea]|uniref:hypothetical protein n=1 Tax=Saccharomonospora cyanea TaxID=40989 RepID=UPI0012FA3B3C|nr:hypothetical protein [Saccharomonospora cyanea]